MFGLKTFNFNLTDYAGDIWINLTVARLHLRIDKRINQSSMYLHLLDEKTNHFARHPNTSELLRLTHVMYQGGLGNFMFQVAGLMGMSVKNQRKPSLLETYRADKYFHNFKLPKINQTDFFDGVNYNDSVVLRNIFTVTDNGWGRFAAHMENVTGIKGYNHVMLSGYMQSWKYFHFIRDDIRSLFTFSEDVYEQSMTAIANALAGYSWKLETLPWLIGIHVRRGDLLSDNQRKHGHEPASEEYLLRTVLHFQKCYPNSLFVVVSNDMPYCRRVFVESSFLFMEHNNEAVDMAILSLMDHVILTVGTYGWWGAYLSDAKEVYYYKHWPRAGSDMLKGLNPEDYFLPWWTPGE